jgi:hypothetical protein
VNSFAKSVQAASVAAARSGPGMRTYLLAGCSVGGTLCASLASSSGINILLAIMSAAFGGMIVLLTAAPGIAAAMPAAAAPPIAAPSAGDVPAALPATRAAPAGFGSVGIGISAGVLSFIMNQISQFGIGASIAMMLGGELTGEQFMIAAAYIGIAVLIVKVPFDLLVGAYLVSRARRVWGALGVMLLTYLFCYMLEQSFSAAIGASGLYGVAQAQGINGVLQGFAWIFGPLLAAQAIGAYGARIAAFFVNRGGR